MKVLLTAFCLMSATLAVVAADGDEALSPDNELHREARLVAAQSTKTILTTTVMVTTVATTCLSKIKEEACKRRKRSSRLIEPELSNVNLARSIDSSLALGAEEDDKEIIDEKQKFAAYTVWWSTTSTYTLTSFVNSGTTLSLSYACSISGFAYPPTC